jgi:hypothetical protein
LADAAIGDAVLANSNGVTKLVGAEPNERKRPRIANCCAKDRRDYAGSGGQSQSSAEYKVQPKEWQKANSGTCSESCSYSMWRCADTGNAPP